ncbi:hypothetical protein ACWGNE_16120 [Streptomyces xiamenensis]
MSWTRSSLETADTVRVGDVIVIGEKRFTVTDLVQTTQGERRLEFATGEALTMTARTSLYVIRQRSDRTR